MNMKLKDGVRIEFVKVIGQIAVGLLGLCGTVLSIWVTQRADNNEEALKMTIENLDTRVIPSMQKMIDEMRDKNDVLLEISSNLRERLARIEGKLESRSASEIAMEKLERILPVGVTITDPKKAKQKHFERKLEEFVSGNGKSHKDIPKIGYDQIQMELQ